MHVVVPQPVDGADEHQMGSTWSVRARRFVAVVGLRQKRPRLLFQMDWSILAERSERCVRMPA